MDGGFEVIAEVERELLAAVVAQPESDAPRRVYADWLQARGDAHGELIALQCQLAGSRERGEPCDELEAVERELLASPQLAWLTPFIEQARRCFGGAMALQRGFLPTTAMACRSEQLIEWRDGLARYAPFIARMRVLDTTPETLERLHLAGSLHGFANVELHGDPYSRDPQWSAGAGAVAPFERLRKLECRDLALEEPFAEQLLARSYEQLETLRFEDCYFAQGTFGVLIDHAPPRLSALRIRGGYFSGAGLERVLELNLRELHVRATWIDTSLAQQLRKAIPRCILKRAPMAVVG